MGVVGTVKHDDRDPDTYNYSSIPAYKWDSLNVAKSNSLKSRRHDNAYQSAEIGYESKYDILKYWDSIPVGVKRIGLNILKGLLQ